MAALCGKLLSVAVLGVMVAGWAGVAQSAEPSGTLAERHFGGTDPAPGVIDEVVGMLVTLLLLPAGWVVAIIGFLVFRAMDVLKPWPASRLEDLHGGLGMMADDLMAAVYGNLLMRLALFAAPAAFPF